jgi:S1-C subfamily serine protease
LKFSWKKGFQIRFGIEVGINNVISIPFSDPPPPLQFYISAHLLFSSKVRLGEKVFTIGYPAHWVMGEKPKYTSCDVNALSGIKDDPTVFQISVQIQPGNSGGPLFNQSGEVIGITQSSLDPKVAVGAFGTLPQNVNYAIKSSYISNLLPMLPETLIASRGISVVPTEPENSLGNFIDKAKKISF